MNKSLQHYVQNILSFYTEKRHRGFDTKMKNIFKRILFQNVLQNILCYVIDYANQNTCNSWLPKTDQEKMTTLNVHKFSKYLN